METRKVKRRIFEFGAGISVLMAFLLILIAADEYPLQGWIVWYLAALEMTSVTLMMIGDEDDEDEKDADEIFFELSPRETDDADGQTETMLGTVRRLVLRCLKGAATGK